MIQIFLSRRGPIKDHRSSAISTLNDLKDGLHKGEADDPRISLIEIVLDEIRYLYLSKGDVGLALEIPIKTVSPCKLRRMRSVIFPLAL